MKTIFLSIITCFIAVTAFAQAAPFTDKQLKSFEDESRGLLNEYLRAIPHVLKAPPSQRNVIIENVKNFFIPGAKIEVVNSTQQKASYTLDNYLGVIVPGYANKFQDAVISFHDVVINSKGLTQTKDKSGNTIYEGDFSYTQMTCFKYKANALIPSDNNEARIVNDFCDETVKSGKFILSQKYSSSDGDVWEIRLGSILVKSEKQIKP